MKKIILTLIAALALFSCEEEVPIDVSSIESKPVMSSLFFNNKPIKVRLSRTGILGADNETTTITNAWVKLYANGQLIDTLTLNNNEYVSDHLAQAGTFYELQVKADNNSFSAANKLPDVVPVIRIDTIKKTTIVMDDYEYEVSDALMIKFTFNDLPGTHFYAIDIKPREGTFDYEYYSYSSLFFYEYDYMSSDLSLDGESSIILYDYLRFPDTRFDNTHKTYSFGLHYDEYDIQDWVGNNIQFDLVFYILSEDFYKYLQNRDLYYATAYDFFAEAVNFYTNVEGGVGIFAGATIVKVPIDITGAISKQ